MASARRGPGGPARVLMAAAVHAIACRAGRGMCRTVPLAGALRQTHLAATGFTNKDLRVLIAGLLGGACTSGPDDLRPACRLRLNGLIRRLPHTNHYAPTSDGIRIAVFYTKVYNRLLVPLTAAIQAQAPPELRAVLATITRHVDDYASRARLRSRMRMGSCGPGTGRTSGGS